MPFPKNGQENLHIRLLSLGGASQPTLHRARVHQTCLLELKSAVGEYREVRNALDVVSSRKLRVLLCVDLEQHGARPSGHGPHHEAQKSTKIGTLLSRTTSSNSAGLTSMGSANAGSAALQAPHLPVSARCFAGIRFAFPHDGQFRITAMTISLIGCRAKRNLQASS